MDSPPIKHIITITIRATGEVGVVAIVAIVVTPDFSRALIGLRHITIESIFPVIIVDVDACLWNGQGDD